MTRARRSSSFEHEPKRPQPSAAKGAHHLRPHQDSRDAAPGDDGEADLEPEPSDSERSPSGGQDLIWYLLSM